MILTIMLEKSEDYKVTMLSSLISSINSESDYAEQRTFKSNMTYLSIKTQPSKRKLKIRIRHSGISKFTTKSSQGSQNKNRASTKNGASRREVYWSRSRSGPSRPNKTKSEDWQSWLRRGPEVSKR